MSIFETSGWGGWRGLGVGGGHTRRMEQWGLPLSLASQSQNLDMACFPQGKKTPTVWHFSGATENTGPGARVHHDGSARRRRDLHGAAPESSWGWAGWKRELKCHLLSLRASRQCGQLHHEHTCSQQIWAYHLLQRRLHTFGDPWGLSKAGSWRGCL